MPRNGAGTATPPAGNPVVAGTTINTTWGNNTVNDIYNELSNSIAKDGQTVVTANLPMAGYRLTGVGDALAMTQNPSMKQVQNDAASYVTTIGGTGDAITLTPTFATTAYTAGLRLTFVAAASNTGATTVNVNSLGVKSVTNADGTALAASQITSGDLVTVRYTGSAFILESSSRSVRNPVSVATIAALKAQTAASNGQSFFVQGYYADGTAGVNNAGDGGGGWFYWDSASTATENGGTIIQATAIATGRFLRVYEGPLSVKWFGAHGDGASDDSAAFSAAIAALSVDGGSVDVPFGRGEVYAINITIANLRGVCLRGTSIIQQSKNSATDVLTDCLIPHNTNNPIITIGDDVGTSASNLTSGVLLENLPFDGRGAGKYGLRLKGGAYRNFYNNLTFIAFTTSAIDIVAAVGTNIFYQYFVGIGITCATAGAIGISANGSAAGAITNITSCTFTNGYIYNWTDTASRCVYCYSAALVFNSVYMQLNGSGYGIEMKKTAGTADPDVWCSLVNIDGDPSHVSVYMNIPGFDLAGSKLVSAYLHGSFACDGLVKFQDGNTALLFSTGTFGWEHNPISYDPVAVNAQYFSNSVNPQLRNLYFSVGGGTSPTLHLTAPGDFYQDTGDFVLLGESSVSRRALQHPLWGSTTNATPKQLTLDGAAAGTGNQYVIPVNHSVSFTGRVLAHQSEAEVTKVSSLWTFQGVIHRGASGNVALVASVTPTMACQTASAAAWVVAVTADTVNQTLAVTVTGEAAKSIKWICSIDFEDILYA